MSQATNNIRLITWPNDPRIDDLERGIAMPLKLQSDRMVLIDVQGASDATLAKLIDAGFERVFENTFIGRCDAPAKTEELVAAYFDWLGADYLHQIDSQRNLSCYELLFLKASSLVALPPKPVLLDVGCGPGTIIFSSIPGKLSKLIGYDLSIKMQTLARAKGLYVPTSFEYENATLNVDIVLSAYVMHYEAGHRHMMDNVLRHMKQSGVWLMNFHKDQGLRQFLAVLASSSGLRLHNEPVSSSFGTVLAVGHRA